MISIMKCETGGGWRLKWAVILPAVVLSALPSAAQTLSDQSLSGKFFFRHVSLGTDAFGNLTDPRSLLGAMIFDGAGNYTFTGQQVVGSNASTSLSGKGTYTVDPAGFVVLDNPQRSGDQVNARLGTEALLGSSTESNANAFDLFAAVPAPASGSPAVFAGSFWTVTLEYPGGSGAAVRNTIFDMTSGPSGALMPITVNGHAANLANGLPQTQPVSGATYTMAPDGTGSFNFGAANTGNLLSGSKTLYLSADGNVIVGGSTATGSHDMVIGVKAVSGAGTASWNGNYWAAGIRTDSSEMPPAVSFSGAVSSQGAGNLIWSRRLNALGFGSSDFTAVNQYTLNPDGSGAVLADAVALSQVGLGAGGKAFVSSAISSSDPNAYEIDFGVAMKPVSGSGIFLNPQAVYNAASFAPAGTPISPGEFITLYLTGIPKTSETATPPYPPTLNGITVLVNDLMAPIYFAGPAGGGQFQINCLVPYATQGPQASIVVQVDGASSNPVKVPVQPTSPGVYSLSSNGIGNGAVLHADYSLVNAAKPAVPGETVLVFLTGMGAVSPGVSDGTAGNSGQLYDTVSPVTILVGGERATVDFNGLAPGYPGLYQINVTLPPLFSGDGQLAAGD